MLVQTTLPSLEPVTLATARQHMKSDVDITSEDTLIEGVWIPAARRKAEQLTGTSLITQGWRLVLDRFPRCIELERGPVRSITSITYRDMAGATQTIAFAVASNSIQRSTDGTLVADLSSMPARITPAHGCTWPVAMPEIGAVAVNYTAGYGDSGADVPQNIISWILLRVGLLHEYREAVVDGVANPLPHVDGLLEPHTVLLA